MLLMEKSWAKSYRDDFDTVRSATVIVPRSARKRNVPAREPTLAMSETCDTYYILPQYSRLRP
jgi:hypothetical protein